MRICENIPSPVLWRNRFDVHPVDFCATGVTVIVLLTELNVYGLLVPRSVAIALNDIVFPDEGKEVNLFLLSLQRAFLIRI